jgi:uncharacterized protein (DUF488 family)
MRLYTIGFAGKRAETFFTLLRNHAVRRVVDIRLHPGGQLAGFAKRDDLPYLLAQLVPGCQYVHLPDLAPTRELLTGYRQDEDWPAYLVRFESLMDSRSIPASLDRAAFEQHDSCLLCSEHSPERCHRRLVAERLAAHWPHVEILHL